MCAIVDNSARDEVFGEAQSAAGQYFFDWLQRGGSLVIGGRLTDELKGSHNFNVWLESALSAGRVRVVARSDVDAEEEGLEQATTLRSDDPHVLALAKVSGARLLYSNDRDLHKDFKNPAILGHSGRGTIYTSVKYKGIRRVHKQLLRRTDICQVP